MASKLQFCDTPNDTETSCKCHSNPALVAHQVVMSLYLFYLFLFIYFFYLAAGLTNKAIVSFSESLG